MAVAQRTTEPLADVMDKKLRILILEDVPSDAELVERELRGAGLAFDSRRVDTRKDFVDALEEFHPTIVLADYQLPQFDGMSALKLAFQRSPGIPVVIVTGSISEETAVECIKAGAMDYVIKDHLARLVPAVQGALERQREREARERAEQVLRKNANRTRLLKEVAIAANEAKGADEALLVALERVCDFLD